MFMDLGLVVVVVVVVLTLGPRTCSLRAGLVQNSLQPFLRWMTVPQIARLKIKCKRFMVKLF